MSLAALCVAGFAITFRLFERYDVPLLPAITVNYATSVACGFLIAPPDLSRDLTTLGPAAMLLGALFVLIFTLSGLSAQRAGSARTTIAGRMSLVLTIAGTVIIFHERIGGTTLLGIGLALVGLVLSSMTDVEQGARRSWALPLSIFLCSGAADISITVIQRTLTTTENSSSFPTLCFAASTCVSIVLLLIRREHRALRYLRTWLGGAALGVLNYASLLFLVQALEAGEYPATEIFPMMNILAILFATTIGITFFRERLSVRQWSGIALCISSLVLIMSASA
ncbi:MAG: hypothetical protein JNM62_07510 [Flavobacteriales bacterium]|nr:hypothetical protein [Flavobacteriales bacterium]